MAQILQHTAGKIAHVDESEIGQAMDLCDRGLGGGTGTGGGMGLVRRHG